MLLKRSILTKLTLLLTVSLARSQSYEQDYESGSARASSSAEDHSAYSEDDSSASGPDYTKYFNAGASSPIVQGLSDGESSDSSGFVKPLDFGQFASGGHFDFGSASNTKELVKPSVFVQDGADPSGFVSADDFKAGFAALASGDFGPKDYFEVSQQRQQESKENNGEEKDSYESKPGPSYTANRAPVKFAYENKGHKVGQATEVHDLTQKPQKHAAPKKYKAPKKEESGEYTDYSDEKENYNYPSSTPYRTAPAPTAAGKVVDYNIGKSSSTVSQNPRAPGYYSKPQPQSPYQKYSFQPAADNYGLKSDYLTSILSTIAPYNPTYGKIASTAIPNVEYQASDAVASLAANKNCKKIDKQIQSKDEETGRFKRQTMNCFICQDPKTKANFEQCSYTTDTAPKNYYASASNRYTSGADSEPYRYKRYSGDDSYSNPYDFVKSQKYSSRPKAFDNKQYQPPKEAAETAQTYKYKPKETKEEPKKSFSEQKADELIKNGENCQKVQREEMSCIVCTSAETGGNYEQCSYSSAPAQQKYAYVREQKFDGPNPNDKPGQGSNEEKSTSKEDESPQSTNNAASAPKKHSYHDEFHRGRQAPLPNFRRDEEQKGSEKAEQKQKASAPSRNPKESRGGSRFQVPKHFEEETQQKKTTTGGRGLDPRLYGGEEEEEEEKKPEATQKKEDKKDEYAFEYPSLSEYHFKYFPEFSKEESEAAESQNVPAKKDVEEVLAEFAKKDRSQCQKAEKNGMTCYLCADKNGLQHEECMYVSESAPKQSHIAYHEKQEVVSKPTADKKKSPTQAKKVQPPLAAAASEQQIQRIKYKATTPLHEEKKDAASNKEVKKVAAPTKKLVTSESRKQETSEADEEDEEGTNEESESSGKQKEETGEKITDVTDPPTPDEFKVGEKEGAFSEETNPVYSKALGITLPKYMLTKSESEAIFDEFVSSK